jgi:phage recombination protein Bet
MSTELALPTSVSPDTWNADTAAMMEFAGLTWIEGGQRKFAPPGIMAGFIAACNRTGLDPTTKQIYAALMSGKWTVLVGVDGMRVVAQRSKEYEGQTPVQWTRDGVTWVDAWLPELQGGQEGDRPAAARAGILRRGFREPLYQVVTWKEFGMDSRFRGDNWGTRPAHMLGIRAETHALRRAFPNDLSGLYTVEDFDTDAVDTEDAAAVPQYSEDWMSLFAAATSRDELEAIRQRIPEEEKNDKLRAAFLARAGVLAREANIEDAVVVEQTTAEDVPPAVSPTVAPSAGPATEPDVDYDALAEAEYNAAVERGEVTPT